MAPTAYKGESRQGGQKSPIYKRQAPAKLNIRLKVMGKRSDGYHELVSLMVPISLFDYLELERLPRKGIALSCQGIPVPNDEKNLACRAAQAFFERTGLDGGVFIRLTKNIPIAAGLGGGSSDAASTLKCLNEMWSSPLEPQDLRGLAAGLGADVPFFLTGRPAIARGIGELLEPIENWPRFWYVIVTPAIRVSTSWVYDNLKLELTKDEYDFIVTSLKKGSIQVGYILENDLESVTVTHFPVINSIKKSLLEAGAMGALMSGSGPSVFGIFRSRSEALSAKRYMSSLDRGSVFVSSGLEC